jgi:hypothetical protein
MAMADMVLKIVVPSPEKTAFPGCIVPPKELISHAAEHFRGSAIGQ